MYTFIKNRQNKCCHPIQFDNSSFKTFIQRTHCSDCTDPQNNILLVSQIGGLHQVNFYIAIVIDDEKELMFSNCNPWHIIIR